MSERVRVKLEEAQAGDRLVMVGSPHLKVTEVRDHVVHLMDSTGSMVGGISLSWLGELGFGAERDVPAVPEKVGAIVRDRKGKLWVLCVSYPGSGLVDFTWMALTAHQHEGGGTGIVSPELMATMIREVVFEGVV